MSQQKDYENDSDEESWSESEEENEPTRCLFCETISKSVELAITHIQEAHNVDIPAMKVKFDMDQYSYLKMINFIRGNNVKPENLLQTSPSEWEDEKYLRPVDYEPWLTFDFEGLENTQGTAVDASDKCSPEEYKNMKLMITKLKQELKEKEAFLSQAAEDIAKMRNVFHYFLDKQTSHDEEQTAKDKELKNCVGSVSLKADEGYFSSYSHYGIHHEMLSDEVRTSSYRDALIGNSEFLKGKTVLDVGCGTGILSMFASKAGAETVVAIDNSDIIYNAMDIAKKNNFENINFIKGRLEDTELPVEKYDVIVSEWMGYFLVFEGMLDSIIYARKRHLKPNGILLPNRCNISLVGYGDIERHQQYIEFWKDVYGFDMTCMQKEVLHEAMIETCRPECVLTESNVIADYDLMKVEVNYSNFSYDFSLKVLKMGELTSFVGYFDTFFDLPNAVSFSTSPEAKTTHWKQVVFFMKDPVHVNEGDVIKGKIICKRSVKDLRSLTVKIKVFDKEFDYVLD